MCVCGWMAKFEGVGGLLQVQLLFLQGRFFRLVVPKFDINFHACFQFPIDNFHVCTNLIAVQLWDSQPEKTTTTTTNCRQTL